MARILPPREKPFRADVWGVGAPVPPPAVGVMLLPMEHGAPFARDWPGRVNAAITNMTWRGGVGGPALTTPSDATGYVLIPNRTAINGANVTVSVRGRIDGKTYGALAMADIARKATPGGTGWLLRPYNYGDEKLAFRVDGPNAYALASTTFSSILGTEIVLTGTYSDASGVATLYRDGAQIAQGTGTAGGLAGNNNSDLYLFGQPGAPYDNQACYGPMAYAFVWDRALTAAEVKAHYADPYMWFRERSRVFYSVPGGAVSIARLSDYYRRMRGAA